jgi:hypothetical protein
MIDKVNPIPGKKNSWAENNFRVWAAILILLKISPNQPANIILPSLDRYRYYQPNSDHFMIWTWWWYSYLLTFGYLWSLTYFCFSKLLVIECLFTTPACTKVHWIWLVAVEEAGCWWCWFIFDSNDQVNIDEYAVPICHQAPWVYAEISSAPLSINSFP